MNIFRKASNEFIMQPESTKKHITKIITNRVKKEVSTTMPGVLPRFLVNSFIAWCPLWLLKRRQKTP